MGTTLWGTLIPSTTWDRKGSEAEDIGMSISGRT